MTLIFGMIGMYLSVIIRDKVSSQMCCAAEVEDGVKSMNERCEKASTARLLSIDN